MSKTQEIMLDTIMRDAAAWHRSRARGAYEFKRQPNTEKSMPAKTRREHDDMFAQQREDADAVLRKWYEDRVVMYGGDVQKLPWNKTRKSDASAD